MPNVAVIGLGKIGLTLAVQIASSSNHKVIGCDISESVVAKVNVGSAPFSGEADLESLLSRVVAEESLVASTDLEVVIKKSEIVIVVIPLIVSGEGKPLWDNIDKATVEIGRHLQPGTLVIYETTLPVGTTRSRFGTLLSQASGLELESNLFLAYSPERVYSGQVFANLKNYPKLVGGTGPISSAKAKAFYESAITFNERPDLQKPNGVWDLGSSESAEMAKLAETTFRDVNIGLANQFAVFAETAGIDIYAVIDACNSQPFSLIHQPGVAVGGHCIPVYPHFYLQGDPQASIVSQARAVNLEMPRHIVNRLLEFAGSLTGKKVVVLGVAYRGGVKEHAFSGVFDLVNQLKDSGAFPVVHDPLYSPQEIRELGLEPHTLGDECFAAVLHTNHKEYVDLGALDLLGCKFLIDGRNASTDSLRNEIPTFVLGIGAV